MSTNYRVWEAHTGRQAGFSAYLLRLLSQIKILDSAYSIYENNNPIWIDWVKWHGLERYHEGNNMEQTNSWDYWFENPVNTEWALKSIQDSPQEWIHSDGIYHGYPPAQDLLWNNQDIISDIGKYTERYFIPNKEIRDSLNGDIKNYKTLAVHCRRSDIGWAHPNLNLNFSEEDFFQNTMKVFKNGSFDKIYLSTEETAIYNYFMKRIPELLLCQHDCYRATQSESLVLNLKLDIRPLHKFLSGKEVLIDIINMSECDSLLCYISGVVSITTYFNNLRFNKIYYHNNVKNNII